MNLGLFLQLGSCQQQVSLSGASVLSRPGWKHCGPHHLPLAHQQLWLEVSLLGIRHIGADLDVSLGAPRP